jgi:hypothetical protein
MGEGVIDDRDLVVQDVRIRAVERDPLSAAQAAQ